MTALGGDAVARSEAVSFAYGRQRVLTDVSFEISVGMTFLLGQNGAGKTTLLKLLQGQLKPASGHVSGPGVESVGYLPQDLTFPGRMRLDHFCEYSGWLRGVPSRRLKVAVAEALDSVGLIEASRQPLRSLSGGMLRRAGIAQALVANPAVLILDEPTDALDIPQKRDLRALLTSLSRHKAIVVSTHNLDDLLEDREARVVILHDGRVVFANTIEQLMRHGQDGSPRARLEHAYLRLTGSLC